MFKITYYYLLRNKLIASLMLLALSITFYFPILSNSLSSILYKQMMKRAEQTPLIITAKGSRFLSVLNTIYFHTETLEPIPYSVYEKIRNTKNLQAIPIYNIFRAKVNIDDDFQSIPIVSTTQDYLSYRGLKPTEGGYFFFPGEIVVGHKLAQEAGLKVGDTLLSEVSSIMNLNAIYPLRLKITGILSANNTEDDGMIFSSLKSSWIMSGLFHGHEKPKELGANYILSDKEDVTVMKSNVISYTEVTTENIRDFHFHGDENELPLTSIIVIPDDLKTTIITASRINTEGQYKAYRPDVVMKEFFNLVFAIHKIFNSYFILIMSSVTCFIAIIILLSSRLRKEEFATIKKLGGSPFIVFKLYACEYSVLLTLSIISASILTYTTITLLKNIFL
jgi:putative ABC transport system permease protein